MFSVNLSGEFIQNQGEDSNIAISYGIHPK